MTHLEYYRYYERTGGEDHGCCSECKVTITDSNCNYDVSDDETGEYVCVECMGDPDKSENNLNKTECPTV